MGFELPQVGFWDFFVGIALFFAFVIIFMLGFLVHSGAKWVIFGFCTILFFALPFLNIIILDNFINKVAFADGGSKKLVYIDSFYLNGNLQNIGKKPIKNCHFNLYTKQKFPFRPDYKVIIGDLDLKVGDKAQIERTIDNFKDDAVREIKIRCF